MILHPYISPEAENKSRMKEERDVIPIILINLTGRIVTRFLS